MVQNKQTQWIYDLNSYRSYHSSKTNRLTHFIGIPLIFFSIFCSLGWFRFYPLDIPLSAGSLFFIGIFIFYFRVHRVLALAVMAWCCPLFLLAEEVSRLPFILSLTVTAGSFVIGWVFQFAGHAIEKNRPAFFTNANHLWRGPLFITYEWVTGLGIKV